MSDDSLMGLDLEFAVATTLSNLSDENLGLVATDFTMNNASHMPTALSILLMELASRLHPEARR